MSAGMSTINTVLKAGATASALTQLCKIKSYPQLGGEPESIETTDMEDKMQTFVPGVQSMSAMQFTANYDKEKFDEIKASSDKEQIYELDFGKDGADGKYCWKGQHSVFINEGAVNGLREMTISIMGCCYGYRAIIEEAKSGQSIEIKSSGAYYVELAISGVSVGEEIKIAVKGYKYNVSTAYTVQTINNRGTDKEWQNPLISNAEHGKLVTAWLADYFASGIQYELDYRGEPAIDCGDTIGQENKYDPDLKTIVEESQITFNAGLLGGGLITRRKECVART